MNLPEALHAAAILAGAFARVSPYYARALDKAQNVDERAAYLRRERPLAHDIARPVAVFSCGGWAKRYPVAAYDLGEDAAVYIVDHLLAHGADGEDAMHEALERWWAEGVAGRPG